MVVTKEQLDEINKYKEVGMSLSWISRKTQIPLGRIKYLKELDLLVKTKTRTKKDLFCDYHFFDKIDTEEKAYWLGFIYADGCITDKGCLKILLSRKDKSHLELFKKHINAEHPIRDGIIKRKSQKNIGMKEGIQYYSNIDIHSKEMAEKLAILGASPRKSLTLKFPTENQVPKHLMRHFIRGNLDGDGHVCSKITGNNRYYIAVGFLSSYNFCSELSKFLSENLSVNKKEITPHHRTKGMGVLLYNSQIDFFKIKDFLYKDATVFLERKRNKFFSIERKEFLFDWHRIIKFILDLESDTFDSGLIKSIWHCDKVVCSSLKKLVKANVLSVIGKTKTRAHIYKKNTNIKYDNFINNFINENNKRLSTKT